MGYRQSSAHRKFRVLHTFANKQERIETDDICILIHDRIPKKHEINTKEKTEINKRES